MKGRLLRLTVYRHDPDDGRPPRFQTYEVRVPPRTTVLELLEEVYRNQDPGLAFRRSCGVGRCGVCAVRVDGRAVLPCRETARGPELRLEPLHPDRVLKDLVVRI